MRNYTNYDGRFQEMSAKAETLFYELGCADGKKAVAAANTLIEYATSNLPKVFDAYLYVLNSKALRKAAASSNEELAAIAINVIDVTEKKYSGNKKQESLEHIEEFAKRIISEQIADEREALALIEPLQMITALEDLCGLSLPFVCVVSRYKP